jgi:hypothetical protein
VYKVKIDYYQPKNFNFPPNKAKSTEIAPWGFWGIYPLKGLEKKGLSLRVAI